MIGEKPSMSDDGRIIVCYAIERNEGIFAFLNLCDNKWSVYQLAGISGNGFLEPGERNLSVDPNEIIDEGPISGFLPDSRLGISNTGLAVYMAIDDQGKQKSV